MPCKKSFAAELELRKEPKKFLAKILKDSEKTPKQDQFEQMRAQNDEIQFFLEKFPENLPIISF